MEDKNQILLESEKDLRDEIKLRITQRDGFFKQAIVFCGALLAFGLSDMGKNIGGSFVLCCGPFVSLVYWRLLMESYYLHDKAKVYLTQQVEPRLKEIVGDDYKPWQLYCSEGSSVSGNQKSAVTVIMLGFAPLIFGVAMLLHMHQVGILAFSIAGVKCTITCHAVLFFACAIAAVAWLVLAWWSIKSINKKYQSIGQPEWQIFYKRS